MECWCGSLMSSGGPAPDGEALCNMPCSGNTNEICGGPDRLSLFRFGDIPTVSPTTSLSVPTSSPSLTVPGPTDIPTGWSYQGCYADEYNGLGRTMFNQQQDNTAMTLESCIEVCVSLGFSVAGMEFSSQCNIISLKPLKLNDS